MKNKKVRGLIWLMLLSFVVGGCKQHEEKDTTMQRLKEREKMDEYFKYVQDSFCVANGVYELEQQYNEAQDMRSNLVKKYSDIRFPKTLAGTMTSELRERGWPIVSKTEEKIKSLLIEYGIDYSWCFKDKDDGAFLSQLFVGVDWDTLEVLTDYGPQYWQNSVNAVIDESNIEDNTTKGEIKHLAGILIKKANNQLVVERKKVERKYAKYCVAVDKETMSNLGLSRYVVDGYKSHTYLLGYWSLNRAQANDLLVRYNVVRVPNQKVADGFFDDSTAHYKSVMVSPNEAQFIKILADGTVEEMPVVECCTNSGVEECYWPECEKYMWGYSNVGSNNKQSPKVGDTDISKQKNETCFKEVVGIIPMQKWPRGYTAAEQQTMDSISNVLREISSMEDEISRLNKAAVEYASAKCQEAKNMGLFENAK